MKNRFTVIVDADAIVARIDKKDSHFEKSARISKKILELNSEVIYPSTAIVEAVTHLQRALSNSRDAYKMAEYIIDSQVTIEDVNHKILQKALKYFSVYSSKKNTLFDCVVLAIAKEKKADAIFSFDKFYTRHGFKLAEDLLV